MAQQWTLWTLELVHLQVAIHQHQAASLRDLLCIPGSKFRLASSIPSPQLQYQLCRQYLPRLQNFELDLLFLHQAQMALHPQVQVAMQVQVALHHQHHQWQAKHYLPNLHFLGEASLPNGDDVLQCFATPRF